MGGGSFAANTRAYGTARATEGKDYKVIVVRKRLRSLISYTGTRRPRTAEIYWKMEKQN